MTRLSQCTEGPRASWNGKTNLVHVEVDISLKDARRKPAHLAGITSPTDGLSLLERKTANVIGLAPDQGFGVDPDPVANPQAGIQAIQCRIDSCLFGIVLGPNFCVDVL